MGFQRVRAFCIVRALHVSARESRSFMAAERQWAADHSQSGKECECVFMQICVYIRCEYLCVCVCMWATDHSQESHRALLLMLLRAFLFSSLLFLSSILLSSPLIRFHRRSRLRSLSAAGAGDKRAALGCEERQLPVCFRSN